jgi:hypothetical protein
VWPSVTARSTASSRRVRSSVMRPGGRVLRHKRSGRTCRI